MLSLNIADHFKVTIYINHTSSTDIYTLSLHDAFRSRWADHRLAAVAVGARPDLSSHSSRGYTRQTWFRPAGFPGRSRRPDRKSTRLNSSHVAISYAVFCLKKNMAVGFIVAKYVNKK